MKVLGNFIILVFCKDKVQPYPIWTETKELAEKRLETILEDYPNIHSIVIASVEAAYLPGMVRQ